MFEKKDFLNKLEIGPNELEKINNDLSAEVLRRTEDLVSRFALFLENNPDLVDPGKLRSEGYLGNGGAGTVLSVTDKTCLKIMDNRTTVKDDRFYDREAVVMRAMNDFKFGNVYTPYFYAYYRTEHNREILMELIDGVNLQRVINGEEELPPAFFDNYGSGDKIDWEKFRNDLIDFVEEMHHSKKVIHGDIELRNVMIDEKGWPVLIDFGGASIIGHLPEKEQLKLFARELKQLEERFSDENLEIDKKRPIRPRLHYKSDKKTDLLSVILNDKLVSLAVDFVKENGVGEVREGLWITDNPEDLKLSHRAVVVNKKVYYLGFK